MTAVSDTAVADLVVSDAGVFDAAVAERAYGIWEQEGRPEGREIEHWLRAEAEMRATAQAGAAMRPARRPAALSGVKSAGERPGKPALKTAAE